MPALQNAPAPAPGRAAPDRPDGQSLAAAVHAAERWHGTEFWGSAGRRDAVAPDATAAATAAIVRAAVWRSDAAPNVHDARVQVEDFEHVQGASSERGAGVPAAER